MTLGPFAFSVDIVVLFASLMLAFGVARIADKGRKHADSALFWSLLIGLVVARLSFIGHYLPAYAGSILKMIDFRDGGFDALPGLIAGGLWLAWRALRKRESRRAIVLSALAGLVGWGTANAAVSLSHHDASVPTVNLTGLDGAPHSLARDDGKPLVVNLWATWCPPCRRELPALAQAQLDYPGLEIVFVDQGESRDDIQAFMTWAQLSPNNVMLDPTLAVSRAVDARAYPTTLFYDAHGKLLLVHLGPFSAATFEHTIESLYPNVAKAKHGA